MTSYKTSLDHTRVPVPFDIILEVAQYFNCDENFKEIRSLSTVCHALRLPCQRRLFSSISINHRLQSTDSDPHPRMEQDPIVRLRSCIESNPQLASYVKNLHYTFWADESPAILPVLNSLKHVEVCAIISGDGANIFWLYIDPIRRDCLLAIIQGPHIERLQFRGLAGIPLSVLDAPTLRCLKPEGTRFMPPNSSTILPLKSLYIIWNEFGGESPLRSVVKHSPGLNFLRIYGKHLIPKVSLRLLIG